MLTVSISETRFAMAICFIFSMAVETFLISLIISIPQNRETIQRSILSSKLLHILQYFTIRQVEDSQSFFFMMRTASYPTS